MCSHKSPGSSGLYVGTFSEGWRKVAATGTSVRSGGLLSEVRVGTQTQVHPERLVTVRSRALSGRSPHASGSFVKEKEIK